MDYLSKEQLLALLDVAKKKGPREHAMTLLGFGHAMRASEVCGLTMADIDIKNETIKIRRLKGSMTSIQPLRKHPGIPLLDELKALKAWLSVRKDDGSPFVFTSREGGRLHRSQFFRVFKALAIEAGIPKNLQRPHVLKHSSVSLALEGGMPLADVKQHAGHKSIQSTMSYTHTSDQHASLAFSKAMMEAF
jgi:integrase